MSRQLRQHQTGDIHHVMAHGIDSLNLFESDQDHHTFLHILKINLEQFNCRCYGFVLMKNHYHIVLRPSGDNFSSMMRVINNTYARYFNKTRKRRGYVFRDRFKSIPTRNVYYVKNLVLYLHANPLRAGAVTSISNLKNYPWSSHQNLISSPYRYDWVHSDFIKVLFNRAPGYRQSYYLEELQSYVSPETAFDPWFIDIEHEIPEPLIPSHIYHSEAEWVRDKIKKAEEKRIFQKTVQQIPEILQMLLKTSCDIFNVSPVLVETKRRSEQLSNALKLFSHWAIRVAGFSGTLVGRVMSRTNCCVLHASVLGEDLARHYPFPVSVAQ